MMKNSMRTSMYWLWTRHIGRSFYFFVLCLAVLDLLGATESFAKSYSFAWLANTEPVEGYKLYYKKNDAAIQTFGSTGTIEGASMIDVGKKNVFTISGLDESAIYYFALRAYNGTDESENSTIITAQPTNSSNNLAPQAIAGKLNPQRATVSAPKGFTIATTTSITQYGITWEFAEPVVSGQFVNGDYWVVGPESGVKIVQITPGYTTHPTTGRAMNGSMINPSSATQGYDGLQNYNSSLNAGLGVSPDTPLILNGNMSLVSTISNLNGGIDHLSYVNTAAVLTCLSSLPPAGSFRPGISSMVKTLHNASSVNYSLLKNLTYPGDKPDINTYADYLQMAWLTHNGSWTGRYMRPSASGLDNYYYPNIFATAALMLHLDYTKEEKNRLLVNYIQLGIDIYSYIESGANGWPPDGGHSSGRKWPILFAGVMLNYAPMKDIGQKSGDYLYSGGHGAGNPPSDYIHFGEDGQTFFVDQSDVNVTNGVSWQPDTRSAPNYPYTAAMIGMPEWGIRYSTAPNRSDASWNTMYRTISSGPPAWAGTALAARMMGVNNLWNHAAYFDFVDRYMVITKGEPDPFGYTVPAEQAGGRPGGIIGKMYDTYRKLY